MNDVATTPTVLDTLIAAYHAERTVEDPPEHERYLLALLDPEKMTALHTHPARKDGGLVLHHDGSWEANVAWISEAEDTVAEDCGYPVDAVEHHDDGLWYWTFTPSETT